MKSFRTYIKNIRPVTLTAIFLCLWVLLDNNAAADDVLSSEQVSQWKSLTAGEKDGLRRTYSFWKDLSAVEKEKVLENFRKFKNLPSGEQKRVIDNHRLFGDMDSSYQKVILKRYEKWLELSPVKKEQLKKRYQMLINMHPEEQAKFYDNYKTWKRLSAKKKGELLYKWSSLSPSQRQAMLSKYGQAFSKERRQEIKRLLKKIRKKKLGRKNLGGDKGSSSAGRLK